MGVRPLALVDGHVVDLADARLPLTDDGAVRGDGAFETVGVWDGRAFRLDDHLQRLARSLDALLLPAPDLELLHAEATWLLAEGADDQDAALRVYVTASGARVLTVDAQPVRAAPRHLVPQPAPWIRPVGEYGPAGAKTMSYAPNMTAARAAQAAGGDEALLVSLEGWVLEGPTFCVLWARDDVLHTPEVALGIVDSITRRTLIELARGEGLPVREGRWALTEVAAADEVLVCSSVRDVIGVEQVGDARYPAVTPVRDRLSAALTAARRSR